MQGVNSRQACYCESSTPKCSGVRGMHHGMETASANVAVADFHYVHRSRGRVVAVKAVLEK